MIAPKASLVTILTHGMIASKTIYTEAGIEDPVEQVLDRVSLWRYVKLAIEGIARGTGDRHFARVREAKSGILWEEYSLRPSP